MERKNKKQALIKSVFITRLIQARRETTEALTLQNVGKCRFQI
jgi:hypothetical protein